MNRAMKAAAENTPSPRIWMREDIRALSGRIVWLKKNKVLFFPQKNKNGQIINGNKLHLTMKKIPFKGINCVLYCVFPKSEIKYYLFLIHVNFETSYVRNKQQINTLY